MSDATRDPIEPLYAVRSIDVWLSGDDCNPIVFHRREEAAEIASEGDEITELVTRATMDREVRRFAAENARLRAEMLVRATRHRCELERVTAERDVAIAMLREAAKTDGERFMEYLARCRVEVAKWPEWQRNILGRYMPIEGEVKS